VRYDAAGQSIGDCAEPASFDEQSWTFSTLMWAVLKELQRVLESKQSPFNSVLSWDTYGRCAVGDVQQPCL